MMMIRNEDKASCSGRQDEPNKAFHEKPSLNASAEMGAAGRDMGGLFYPEMAILTLEKASRAYRTLRGAFLISENGITHFGRASRWTDIWRLLLS